MKCAIAVMAFLVQLSYAPVAAQVHGYPVSRGTLDQSRTFDPRGGHARYSLVVIGTFGGPSSFVSIEPGVQILSADGSVTGCADTSHLDPNYPNFNPFLGQDTYIQHEFEWHDGFLKDLGALPGPNSSCAESGANVAISGDDLIIASSGNGVLDPLTGWPEARAVLFSDDQIIRLGTLGGNESVPIAVNDRGQITGAAANSIADPLSFFGFGTQTRAFLWQRGVMQDLGTLGGPDAFGISINERGQVLGFSYINSIPNATTGIPTGDGFLWDQGVMMDIKDPLGGTIVSPFSLNKRGQVVGSADLPGDVVEQEVPFLWYHGVFTDLGTFGGTRGHAARVNDSGQIAGDANLCDTCFQGGAIFHAFLWEHGFKTDLGAVGADTCSVALDVNSRGQAVGHSEPCDFSTMRASLWQYKEPPIDLNTLIPVNSGFRLLYANNINERGEITGLGILPNGNARVFLLIPTENDSLGSVIATPQDLATLRAPIRGFTHGEMAIIRAHLTHRHFGLSEGRFIR